MVKEIFVIGDGILFFHYSRDQTNIDSDQAILSSGLLSAIMNFSTHTRSETVGSFSTENEYFLFKQCCETTKELVGVFDRKVPEQLARDTLQKIHDLISHTQIPQEKIPTLKTPEKEFLKDQIAKLVPQLFGTKEQAIYMEELLQQRTNIPLAFLVDANERKVIAHFARPKHLFKEEHVRDFLLVFSNLSQTLSKLEISQSYFYFSICSREYAVGSCWSGKSLCVATGTPLTSEKEVLEAAVNICYHPSVDSLVSLSEKKELVNRSTLLKDGKFIHEEGTPFPSLSGIFLSTLVNNLNRFFRLLSRRNFDEFDVVTPTLGRETKKLSIRRKGTSEDFVIELFHYT